MVNGTATRQDKAMLYLTRKVGESIMLNENVEVTVVAVRGRTVKLGFVFPSDVSVMRREIYDRIQEENRAAAAMTGTLVDELREKGK